MQIKTDLLTYPENPKVVALPPAGGKYIDDLAGIEVLRLTDENHQRFGKGSFSTTYPVWIPFNKDSSKIWYFEHGGPYFVGSLNPITLEKVGTPLAVEPARGSFVGYETMNWSNLDPDLGFITVDTQIWGYRPSTNSYPIVVADLRSSFPANARFDQLYVSKDDNRFAAVVRTKDGTGDLGFMVYDRPSKSIKLNVTMDQINGIGFGKEGRYVLVVPEDKAGGQRKQFIYDADTGLFETLLSDNNGQPDYTIGHNDTGMNFLVGGDGFRGAVTTRELSTPHNVTLAWHYASILNGWIYGWHVGLRTDQEEWALMSSFDGFQTVVNGETVVLPDGPFVREIWQLGVKAPFTGQVRRLLHARANWEKNYWTSPRAGSNREGSLVAWTHNNNGSGTDRTDVYVARIPIAPSSTEPLPPPPPPPPTSVTISGKILKKDGTPVKGVRVMINPGTKTQMFTKDDGSFAFTGLKPGKYVVIAGASNPFWVYQPGYRAMDVKQNVGNADFVAVDSNDPELFK